MSAQTEPERKNLTREQKQLLADLNNKRQIAQCRLDKHGLSKKLAGEPKAKNYIMRYLHAELFATPINLKVGCGWLIQSYYDGRISIFKSGWPFYEASGKHLVRFFTLRNEISDLNNQKKALYDSF
tara:strand:+ start:3726 stop:4103 length:378 start_codon:yes stop_codon:yes gene_type:complete